MDKKTQGAWIVHHAKKLQAVATQDFDQISFSGKCGLLLSAMAANSQSTLPKERVQALAKANQISPRTELPAILLELRRQRLIDEGSDAVEVLGLTTAKVLDHTTQIFQEGDPTSEEIAVVEIAEKVSEQPGIEADLVEEACDEFDLSEESASDLFAKAEDIGFFDAEKDGDGQRFVFNGNLFRGEDAKKITSVLGGLTPAEAQKVQEFNGLLGSIGCVPLRRATDVLGKDLFRKLHSIGLYDVNQIGNELGSHFLVTRPAAFSKFTGGVADDAFDLAKALVSALTYGMTSSPYGRGRIQMISALMSKLIDGQWVGPATAIGKDYQALELRGVIEVRPASGGMFYMRMLKPEVGRLALSVIQEGDVVSEAMASLPAAAVTKYVGPESNRAAARLKVSEPLRRGVGDLLAELRTGGIR